jgi:hypothetical protein
MSNLTLYKWKIYCVTDSTYEYIWLDENQPEPTTCPTNTAHTIDATQTSIVETRAPDIVNINQEDTLTGQNYAWNTQSFTALANQTTSYTFSFPFNISVLEAQFISAEENRGDSWSWVIAPNTTIGALTGNVSVDDTVINVSPTVTANIKVGFYVNLFDGVNTEELGRVLAIDSDAGTITVETASTQAFSALSPTYVRMNIYFMKDAVFGHPWNLIYGEGKIKSSFVPANTLVQVDYTNNSPSTDKVITCSLEILY